MHTYVRILCGTSNAQTVTVYMYIHPVRATLATVVHAHVRMYIRIFLRIYVHTYVTSIVPILGF